jgi:hypothetical protein
LHIPLFIPKYFTLADNRLKPHRRCSLQVATRELAMRWLRYRGRGILMITGRKNYRALDYENDPDKRFHPYHAAYAAAGYGKMNSLNERTRATLNRQQFVAADGSTEQNLVEIEDGRHINAR